MISEFQANQIRTGDSIAYHLDYRDELPVNSNVWMGRVIDRYRDPAHYGQIIAYLVSSLDIPGGREIVDYWRVLPYGPEQPYTA